jgi:hypothetical protein
MIEFSHVCEFQAIVSNKLSERRLYLLVPFIPHTSCTKQMMLFCSCYLWWPCSYEIGVFFSILFIEFMQLRAIDGSVAYHCTVIPAEKRV